MSEKFSDEECNKVSKQLEDFLKSYTPVVFNSNYVGCDEWYVYELNSINCDLWVNDGKYHGVIEVRLTKKAFGYNISFNDYHEFKCTVKEWNDLFSLDKEQWEQYFKDYKGERFEVEFPTPIVSLERIKNEKNIIS